MDATTYGANKRTRINIGRKDKIKDGTPVFKRWLPAIPADDRGRVFEQYNEHTFEVFESISGYVQAISLIDKEIAGDRFKQLVLDMVSGDEAISVEISRLDHRFAQNLMNRISSPEYKVEDKVTLKPYDFTDNNGKRRMGISLSSAGFKVETVKYEDQPEPITGTNVKTGKTDYNFLPVAEWLYAKCDAKINSMAPAAVEVEPTNTRITARVEPDFYNLEPGEDLPF
jgi:hypothetical protein